MATPDDYRQLQQLMDDADKHALIACGIAFIEHARQPLSATTQPCSNATQDILSTAKAWLRGEDKTNEANEAAERVKKSWSYSSPHWWSYLAAQKLAHALSGKDENPAIYVLQAASDACSAAANAAVGNDAGADINAAWSAECVWQADKLVSILSSARSYPSGARSRNSLLASRAAGAMVAV